MQMRSDKEIVKSLLEKAGVKINGNRDFDITVYDDRAYGRILRHGTLGVGESYMDGWWDCKSLDQLFYKIFQADLDGKFRSDWDLFVKVIASYVLNTGKKSTAFKIGEKHYDIGNDLYAAMLDKRMTYTCGYWKNAKNLDQAQEAKLDLVCRKINLQKGQKVLDIGSGWGSFIGYAAEKYGVNALGITVSKEQTQLANERYKNLPAKTVLSDYRDVGGQFDKIVSLGMFEHVGRKNYRTFMKTVHGLLKDDGLFLLHTIGGNGSGSGIDPWINKYIFPGGMIPSVSQIGKSIENLFVMEDWHNFGAGYDKTLMAWHKNFNKNWDKIKSNYDERFHRMWNYYLLICAASFRARRNQLWQIVLSKQGVPGGYNPIR
jgi:cyclopropane-fatty-acyl-phospholipid synthase